MLQVKEIIAAQIEKEIECAKNALKEGNIGKARVCARRAAGLAVNFWLLKNKITSSDLSAVACLNKIKEDENLPDFILKAAGKLTAKINTPESGAVTEDPLKDSMIIVEYFLS